MTTLTVAVIGDFDDTSTTHLATNEAIAHAASGLEIDADIQWVATASLEDDLTAVGAADALWCAPGSPYQSMLGALRALRYGREQAVPTLGTCGGCQHMIIEYARHVLGVEDAQHAEYDPYGSRLFVTPLSCSLVGRTMSVTLSAGSKADALYGTNHIREQYYCNFGLNPDYVEALNAGGLRVTGTDADGEARVLELPDHPFYIATLFVPQTRSTPERPHPLIVGFLHSALERNKAPLR